MGKEIPNEKKKKYWSNKEMETIETQCCSSKSATKTWENMDGKNEKIVWDVNLLAQTERKCVNHLIKVCQRFLSIYYVSMHLFQIFQRELLSLIPYLIMVWSCKMSLEAFAAIQRKDMHTRKLQVLGKKV